MRPFMPVFAVTFMSLSAHMALAAPSVVTTIKPLNSLVAAVMEGVATPYPLVKAGASPHTYALRPSDATALQNADLVFWIGKDLEAFLVTPLKTLAGDAAIVSLGAAEGLTQLPFRTGGTFEHGHSSHGEEDHDAHGDHDEGDHDEGEHEADHHDEADHDAEHSEMDAAASESEFPNIDLHIWLDPENAKIMVKTIAATLVEVDIENSAIYAENAETLLAELDDLIVDVNAILEPVRDQPFVVFHDGYQYFEHRFGLNGVGSITVSPEVIPGVRRLTEIRQKVQELNVACVFAEPQFTPRLISVVIEGTNAKSGVLDPLGSELTDDGDLYPILLRSMASSMANCLEN